MANSVLDVNVRLGRRFRGEVLTDCDAEEVDRMDRSELYKDERSTGEKMPSYTIIVVALCIATPE